MTFSSCHCSGICALSIYKERLPYVLYINFQNLDTGMIEVNNLLPWGKGLETVCDMLKTELMMIQLYWFYITYPPRMVLYCEVLCLYCSVSKFWDAEQISCKADGNQLALSLLDTRCLQYVCNKSNDSYFTRASNFNNLTVHNLCPH